MIGGAWRAEKTREQNPFGNLHKPGKVFSLPKAIEMGALHPFYLYPQRERISPTDI